MAFAPAPHRAGLLSPRRKRKAKDPCSWRTVLILFVILCFLLKFTLQPKVHVSSIKNLSQQGTQLQLSLETPPGSPCHILVISTYPPRKCGIAQFTQLFLNATLRVQSNLSPDFQCHYSVLALDDTDDMTGYDPHFVVGKIVKDTVQPGMSFWNTSRWILNHQEKAAGLLQKSREEGVALGGLPKSFLPFTHMLTQVEFGIVWHKWQMLDLVRWVVAGQRKLALPIGDLQSVLVCHSPFAYPHIEEKGFVRHLVDHSSAIVALSWHGYHSLVTAYGVPEAKVFFVPHGVDPPSSPQRARTLQPPPILSRNDPPDVATLEHLMSLPAGHQDRPLLIMSHGLIHKNKGFQRIVRNLREILDQMGGKRKVALLILGMEHSKNVEQHTMPALLEEATALGVRPYITWHSEYVSQSDISKWLGLSDVYASMYEEVAATSGALLQAMAHGCAIVATSYRFAIEVLTDERGLVVPFEDDSRIQGAFLSLLKSPPLREKLGRNAARFARHWSWDNVAAQFRLLFAATQAENERRNGTRFTSKYLIDPLEKPAGVAPLTPDPFGASYHLDSELYGGGGVKTPQEFVAHWSADRVVTFHGVEVHSGGLVPETQRVKPGVYGVYADRELQVNGVISSADSYAFTKVAVRWRGVRIVADHKTGVKEPLLGEREVVEGPKEGRLDEYRKLITLFKTAERRRLLGATEDVESFKSDGTSAQDRRKGQSMSPSVVMSGPLEIVSIDPSLYSSESSPESLSNSVALALNSSDSEGKLGSSRPAPLIRRHLASSDGPFYEEVLLRTGQVTVAVTVKPGREVTVTLHDASRFDHPHGLLGQTLRCAWDLPVRTSGLCPATFRKELFIGDDVASLNPDVWRVAGSDVADDIDSHLYDTNIPGQKWEIWSVYFNEVEDDQLWLKGEEFKYVPR